MTADSRTVTGGGGGTIPTTYFMEYLRLGEYIDRDGVPGYSADYDSLIAWVDTSLIRQEVTSGNGYVDHSLDLSVAPNYVLGSYTTYVLWFSTTMFAYGDTRGVPTVTITHEYGGPYSSRFEGYRGEMNFTTLPEPSVVVGLVAGLVPFLRRRRR